MATVDVDSSSLPADSQSTYFGVLWGLAAPFCVTRSNPTHQLTDPTQPNPPQLEKFGPNPSQPDTINNGAYSLVVAYFIHRTYLELVVDQASTYSCSLLIIIHNKTSVIMSLNNKLFKEMFSNFAIVDSTQPTKNWKISTQPDPTQPVGQPNPWTTVIWHWVLLSNEPGELSHAVMTEP